VTGILIIIFAETFHGKVLFICDIHSTIKTSDIGASLVHSI
jgi:hypothetical protein